MKKGQLKAFWRIFDYVWPQWPKLIIVVVTAVMIGILFSLSFMTVIPLLKVMMGEEGLHGWVDRKTCLYRYGMDFYVPDKFDVTDNNSDVFNYLLIANIDKDCWAQKADLRNGDKIIGIGTSLIDQNDQRINSSKLLEELATAQYKGKITLQVLRDDENGIPQLNLIQLSAESKDSSIYRIKQDVMIRAQQLISYMPRGQEKANQKQAVSFIIILMVFVTIIRCIATFLQKYMAENVVQIAIAKLRKNAFDHVMNMPVGFFSIEGTSDTTSRIIGDTSTAGKGVKIFLGKALREPIKAVCTLFCAMIISWKLTLIFLCCAPPTIGMFGLLGKKIKKATKRSLMSSALMLGKIQEVTNALRVVKVYNRQNYESDSYQSLNNRFLRQVLKAAKVEAGTGPLMDFLATVAMAAALIVGAHWVFSVDIRMDPSAFFGLLVMLGTSAESIRKVSDVWNKIQAANAAAERVFAVVDAPLEIENSDAIDLLPIKEKIEFCNVTFTYPGAEDPVLKDINLTVRAGQNVAVVGPNGSGKTTLVNLIPRFYDLDSGMILLDGQNIRHASLKTLRNQISMVTQNVVTFNDTIAANIGYGKENATREEIIEAAKRSFAHEFIEPLPDGYDTVIGEQGSGFSGGQLQRIVIARAIVKNPAILIFDEAMSQVDADSEAKIHQALSELITGRTCFVIAHRFSTVITADTIVVIEDGRIIAQGIHDELIQICETYRNLYETQLVAPQ